MGKIYTKLNATKPIRPDDVTLSGATYVAIGVTDDSASADSTLYDYTEKRIDYYYSKDDNNLKAVVGKVEIAASDNYIAAKKIKYIETVKTFTVSGTDTVTYDGATYTWTATGTTAGAGAWADEDDTPVSFTYTIDENVLDAIVSVVGTTYTRNYLWLKNVIDNVAVNSAAPISQSTGSGVLYPLINTYLTANNKLVDKSEAFSYTEEGDTGVLKFIKADADGDHEGKEVNVSYTIFVSESNEYNAVISVNTSSIEYELAQALDDMDIGDKINLTTLAIS